MKLPSGKDALILDEVVGARRAVRAGRTIAEVARDLEQPYGVVWRAVVGQTYRKYNDIEPPVETDAGSRQRQLTDDQVCYARREVRKGRPRYELADELGVSYRTLCHAVGGTTYCHLNAKEAPIPSATKGRRPNTGPYSLEKRARIRQKYESELGVSVRQIAKEEGVSVFTVVSIGQEGGFHRAKGWTHSYRAYNNGR